MLISRADIISVEVPHYKEFTVSSVYSLVEKFPDTKIYLPDFEGTMKRKPNRAYVFNVINTKHRGYITNLVCDAIA